MPNKSRPPPIRKHLLAALPSEEYERPLPQLESVPLSFMEVLCEGYRVVKEDGLRSGL